MKIKKNFFFIILLCPLFFFFSLTLLDAYKLGDQIHYIRLYENLKYITFFDVTIDSKKYINSIEPLSAYILWFGSYTGIEKNIYISILNLILLIGIFLLFKKHKCPWYLLILFFSNFYLIVLLTAAERLKISYIVLVYAALFYGKLSTLFTILSPLAHLQSIIILPSLFIIKNYKMIISFVTQFKVRKSNYLYFIIIIILVFFIFIFLKNLVIEKYLLYTIKDGEYGFIALKNILLLIIIGLIITRYKTKFFISFLPLIFATYVLGGTRVNMISVSLFIYLILIEGRIKHPLSILILLYFSIKSIPFIKNIFLNGNGFDGFLF
jgi:hypothetical protein